MTSSAHSKRSTSNRIGTRSVATRSDWSQVVAATAHIFHGSRYLQNFCKNFRDPGSDGTTRLYIRPPSLAGSMRGSLTLLSRKSGPVPERIQEETTSPVTRQPDRSPSSGALLVGPWRVGWRYQWRVPIRRSTLRSRAAQRLPHAAESLRGPGHGDACAGGTAFAGGVGLIVHC